MWEVDQSASRQWIRSMMSCPRELHIRLISLSSICSDRIATDATLEAVSSVDISVPSPCWARWWVGTSVAENPCNGMEPDQNLSLSFSSSSLPSIPSPSTLLSDPSPSLAPAPVPVSLPLPPSSSSTSFPSSSSHLSSPPHQHLVSQAEFSGFEPCLPPDSGSTQVESAERGAEPKTSTPRRLSAPEFVPGSPRHPVGEKVGDKPDVHLSLHRFIELTYILDGK